MGDIERIRGGFEAFQRGDLDALRELLAPDVTWFHWDPGPWDCHGRDAVLARLRQRMEEGFAGRLADVAAHGDKVFLRIVKPHVCLVVTLRDGLIAHMRDHGSEDQARIDAGLAEHVPPVTGPADVHQLVPFAHVADVAASAAFYAHLGFEVLHTHEPAGRLDWCWLETPDGAQLMLVRAEEPVERERQAVLFFLYTHDLAGLRERLVAAGLRPSPIYDGTPGPRYEMRLADPDGYVLMIAQTLPT